jgi:hypothetical protein
MGTHLPKNSSSTPTPPETAGGDKPSIMGMDTPPNDLRPRPISLPVRPENIPAELKQIPRWVCWDGRWEKDAKGNDKLTKRPIDPKTGGPAKSNDPNNPGAEKLTWGTFEQALTYHQQNLRKTRGIGFVLDGDGIIGVDLDDVRDPVTGELLPWAQTALQALNSYCEVSPSGTGIKLFVRGAISSSAKAGQKEMYSDNRFFTVTGHRLESFSSNVESRPDTLMSFHKDWFGSSKGKPLHKPSRNGHAPDRQKIIDRAQKYVATMDPAISGQGGHNQTFAVACRLAIDFDLSEEEAWPLLCEYNERCQPPWKEMELRHKLTDAMKQPGERGCKLHQSEQREHTNKPVSDRPASGQRQDAHHEEAKQSAIPAESEPELAPSELWPEPMAEEAFHGILGKAVRAIEPATEADPVALLLQMLTGFGNAIGRTAHFRVEGDTHYLNLFISLIGKTSKGRKGTSWGRVRQYLEQIDGTWLKDRVQGGLASGEGMVFAIRDPVVVKQPIRKAGRVVGYEDVVVDHGVEDKRLLCLEEEYAGVMRMLERQANSLSQRMREAWQGRRIGSMTKNTPTQCREPHISIIGHGTMEETRRYLGTTEIANGWGNRHLWALVQRSKVLPNGGHHEPDPALLAEFRNAYVFARGVGELRRDAEADEHWKVVYELLSAGQPGLAGSMLGRAEAQVMRLACLYAVLDKSPLVKPEHLNAALAIWDYCEASVRIIFGDSTGDDVADEILRLLRSEPEGVTRNEIMNHFGRHRSAGRIANALGVLRVARLAHWEKETTGGRPAERWFAGDKAARKAS